MSGEDRSREFMMQFVRHEHDLFRYVLTLLPSWNDAQDVMQETAAALWQKFDQFDPDRPFLPWACQFAYHQVLNVRSRQKTRRRMFSDAVIYDAGARRVTHFVDGEPVSRETLRFEVPLRIGNADLGNWSVGPHTTIYPLRCFTGRMDELAIYGRALPDHEVQDLCNLGTPKPRERR